MTSRRQLLTSALAFGPGMRALFSKPHEALSHSEPCMGTMFTVRAYHQDEEQGYRAIAAAFRRMHALDATLSDYRPDSELNRLCRSGYAQPFSASDDLYRVLESGIRMARKTGGAFDVTLGPLIQLWRSSRKAGVLPDTQALRDARARSGWDKIVLDSRNRTVRLSHPGMLLDFGGIAKGYAADAALAELARHGVNVALVAAGGDIAASAPPAGSPGWGIALKTGREPQQPAVMLAHQAVSTSGDLHQFVEIAGTRYSHILDPQSGIGLAHPMTVSVVAGTAMDSDSTATALSVMGFHQARAWLRKHPEVQARIVRTGDHGETSAWQTRGFPLATPNSSN